MAGTLDLPTPHSRQDYSEGLHYVIHGAGDHRDEHIVNAVVLINPATAAPYAITEMIADSVALHDTDTPSNGAAVSADGALSVEGNHYGTPNPADSVSVGTASTAVLAANATRTFLALCNDSANTIYIDLSGATAVASKGIRLNANGGSLVLDRYVPRTAIKAIASGAGSVLTIQEA